MQFNEILQQKTLALNNNRLRWLDFLPALLTDDRELDGRYEFDGTHLHPNYVELLEKSISK
jgi:hypothetical protein